ncbi:zf-CCHC domain-containing protein [Tanacetum coccineum]
MNSDLNNQNDQWELNLDIDDSNPRLTPLLLPCSNTRVETSTTTQKLVRKILGPAGIVQAANLLKQTDFQDGRDRCVMSTQVYMKKVVKDVGEDEEFKSGSWVSATNYVNANGGIMSGCLGDIKNFLKNEKLDQVVAIVKSCSPNVIGDLTMTLKDLSGIKPGTIHYKLIDEGGYAKDITIAAALILANVFRMVMVPRSGSGMNVTDQEMEDEEALNLALDEEARQARAERSG